MTATQLLTLVFTDVVGSTRLLARLGDNYPELLERHRSLLREAFSLHQGLEEGTEGDSFFVTFGAPEEAVAACLDGQLGLAAEPWPSGNDVPVRMGVHTGAVTRRDGQLYGLAVHEAARIGAAAHGGQVVVSAATRQLTGSEPAPGCSYLDLGEHRLRDVDELHRLFQLLHPGLAVGFPPLASQSARHNLPRQLTALIGREADTAAVTGHIARHPVVTLTGSGGVGKTRLALEAAHRVLPDFQDGVWLVELASLDDPANLPSAVAAPLGIRPGPPERVMASLTSQLLDRAVLLVLDNCEHLLDACAATVSELVGTCAGLHVLATSREALGVPGELVRRVGSLTVAPVADDVDDLLAADATRLFLDRASGADDQFVLPEGEVGPVADICRRLDGIPLAIELAAARVGVLSPTEISARLDERFRLLTGGPRTAVPRQKTLEAAVAWSYDLLDESEQALFRQLSVFAGGFTVEAVEGVTPGLPESSQRPWEALASLVAKSMVMTDPPVPSGGPRRHRLLETIRAFGRTRLTTADELDDAAERHANWYRRWTAEQLDRLGAGVLDAEIVVIERERADLLAALEWTLEANRPEHAAELALPLTALWLARDYLDEAGQWSERLAQLPSSGDLGAVLVVLAAIDLSHNADAARGLERARRGVELLHVHASERRHGSWLESLGLSMQAIASSRLGDSEEAFALFDESVRVARASGDRYALASALCTRAGWPDPEVARACLAEATALCRSLGSDIGLCRCGWHLSELEAQKGNLALGAALAEEAVEAGRQFGPSPHLVNALVALAQIRFQLGDPDGAGAAGREALGIAERTGSSEVARAIRDGLRLLDQR